MIHNRMLVFVYIWMIQAVISKLRSIPDFLFFKMNSNFPHDKKFVEEWYRATNNEALNRNLVNTTNWTRYKSEIETVKSTLEWLPKQMSHKVLVPVGPRALMPGKIVHTNECLVNLGDNWFVNKSAHQTTELCDRRIQLCNENIERLDKERILLEQRQYLPQTNDAFGNIERPEIEEKVTEEEELEWRKQHRQKERQYRKQLAEMKEKESSHMKTEEELWKRLEELELMEELEDELIRMNRADNDEEQEEGYDDERQEEGYDNEEQKEEYDDEEELGNKLVVESEDKINQKDNNLIKKKRICFEDDFEDFDRPLKLDIKHSSNSGYINKSGQIDSPADLFRLYKQTFKTKSILVKPVNQNRVEELRNVKMMEVEKGEEDFQIPYVKEGIRLPDVKERTNRPIINKTSKVSHFKRSRMNH